MSGPLLPLHRLRRAYTQWLGRGQRSSISDVADYRTCCARAAADPSAFATFRRDPAYPQILEHADAAAGAEAGSIALERHPQFGDLLDEFRRNDFCGGPLVHRFDGFGEFSPTTLRYVKVLGDLEWLFGDLSGLRIVEIGGGYGGQCRIIRSRFRVGSYTIHDLPEAAQLAKRYLDAFQIQDVAFNPPLDGRSRAVDLLISNYALSEIRRSMQDRYFAELLSGATRGYMIWNASAIRRSSLTRLPARDLPYSAEDVVARIPGARIERALPLVLSDDIARNNVLITWG